jgi:hypothetical protein
MIELNANETMLLLAAKNHKHGGFESTHQLGSLEYLQQCCNMLCWGKPDNDYPADMYVFYGDLALKLLSALQFKFMLDELIKDEWFRQTGLFTRKTSDPIRIRILYQLISKLANRKVTDLTLDESLMAKS